MMGADMNNSTAREGAGFGDAIERRGASRFPVREDVRYTVVHSRTRKTSGSGRTLNFGSGGILFTTEQQLPVGRKVELAVAWPALLGGQCPLQFVATGRVVRSESNRAAVRIHKYEFRTRGASASAGSGR
jgi:hypothetical protein